MTKGTIINKETGLRIEGTRTGDQGTTTFLFHIPGTSTPNGFLRSDWDFEPVKPTPQEQFAALKLASKFRFEGDPTIRIKLNDEFYATVYGTTGRPEVFRIEFVVSDIEEIIE